MYHNTGIKSHINYFVFTLKNRDIRLLREAGNHLHGLGSHKTAICIQLQILKADINV